MPTPTRKNVLFLATAALLAAFAGIGIYTHRSATLAADRAALAAAETFYVQELQDATGVQRKMDVHRGKVVVVNFWATWCVPCVQEIPLLSKAHADANGRVAFVGLGIDSPSNIAAFGERFKPSYPLLVAGAGGTQLAQAFGDEGGGLPFTVVLSPEGRVIASHLGKVDEAMLDQWIRPYLGGKVASSTPMPAS